MKAIVSIVKCEDYESSAVSDAVRNAVDLLGGMHRFVKPGQKVLLKPNLLSARPPEDAVTTHPAIIEAAAILAVEAGGVCSIGDSPAVGGETLQSFTNLLKVTGVQDVIDRTGTSYARFDGTGGERAISGAKIFHRIPIAAPVTSADVLINLPKFKTHELMRLSAAVKNLYGCIPGYRKAEFHFQAGDNPVMFAQILVDLLRAVRPALSIMDGIVGMDGNGPSAGRRRNFNLLMASDDPVALDVIACRLAGVDPMDIPYLRLASDQGIGATALGDIEIRGVPLDEVQISDFLLPSRGDMVKRMPSWLYKLLKNQLVWSPAFDRKLCTGCRACAKICPLKAISGQGKKLKVDYSTCIRCYCCQEVCPQASIYLKTGALRRLIESLLSLRQKVRSAFHRD